MVGSALRQEHDAATCVAVKTDQGVQLHHEVWKARRVKNIKLWLFLTAEQPFLCVSYASFYCTCGQGTIEIKCSLCAS